MQAPRLNDPTSEIPVSAPGQPLFVNYQADPLIRGVPAKTFLWRVNDTAGGASEVYQVLINIRCSPGYFYTSDNPSQCSPCLPGSYNLPGEEDQASLLNLLVSTVA